jgi:hypothetical protein
LRWRFSFQELAMIVSLFELLALFTQVYARDVLGR